MEAKTSKQICQLCTRLHRCVCSFKVGVDVASQIPMEVLMTSQESNTMAVKVVHAKKDRALKLTKASSNNVVDINAH